MKYEDFSTYLNYVSMEHVVQIIDKVGTKYVGFVASYSETALTLVEHHDFHKLRKVALINIKDILSIQVSDDVLEYAKKIAEGEESI